MRQSLTLQPSTPPLDHPTCNLDERVWTTCPRLLPNSTARPGFEPTTVESQVDCHTIQTAYRSFQPCLQRSIPVCPTHRDRQTTLPESYSKNYERYIALQIRLGFFGTHCIIFAVTSTTANISMIVLSIYCYAIRYIMVFFFWFLDKKLR